MHIVLFVVLTILFVFYKTNAKFKFYLKILFYCLYSTVIAIVIIPLFALRPRNPRNLVFVAICAKPLIALLGLKYVLKGKKHLEKNQPFILVMNHQSILDVLGMLECVMTLKQCTIIAKKEILWNSGPYGIAAWLSGLVFIQQGTIKQTEIALDKAVAEIKKNKFKLIVCPEGGVCNNGTIQTFKKGAFHLAVKSQLPIVPLVFSQLTFFDKDSKRFDSGKVIIRALPPIETEELTATDVNELTEKTRDLMIKTFIELNSENHVS